MSRFAQRLTTSISSWLSPALMAPVTSMRHGAHHTTPRSLPVQPDPRHVVDHSQIQIRFACRNLGEVE